MKKQGLISKMISLSVAATISFALTGCTDEELHTEYNSRQTNSTRFVEDEYVIVNGELHKGDVIAYRNGQGVTNPLNSFKIDCDCGEEIECINGWFAYETKPNENLYKVECEECFNQQ